LLAAQSNRSIQNTNPSFEDQSKCIRWLSISTTNALFIHQEVRLSTYLFHQSSNDEHFLTLSFGAEDKPNNNNFIIFFLKSFFRYELAYDLFKRHPLTKSDQVHHCLALKVYPLMCSTFYFICHMHKSIDRPLNSIFLIVAHFPRLRLRLIT
jgi:hypothetical protein